MFYCNIFVCVCVCVCVSHSLNSCFRLNIVQFKLTFVTPYKMFSYLRSSVAEAEKLISHEAGGVKQTINNWQ